MVEVVEGVGIVDEVVEGVEVVVKVGEGRKGGEWEGGTHIDSFLFAVLILMALFVKIEKYFESDHNSYSRCAFHKLCSSVTSIER